MSENKKLTIHGLANYIDLNFDIEEYEHSYTFGSTYTYFQNLIKDYIKELQK